MIGVEMDMEEIEARLKDLSGLVGSNMELNLFNTRYAVLLRDINKLTGPRYGLLFRLKQIGCHQMAHVMTLCLRAKREDATDEAVMEGMN